MKIQLLKEYKNSYRVMFFFEDEKIIIDEKNIVVDDFIFNGKNGSQYLLSIDEKKYLLVGLGKEEEFKIRTVKKAVMSAGKFFEDKKVDSIDIVIKDISKIEKVDILKSIVDALAIGLYRFDVHLSKKEYSKISSVNLIIDKILKEDEEIVSDELRIALASNNARDLVMRNAEDLTPETFKNEIESWAKTQDVSIKILNRQQLIDEKMGLISAVGRGGSDGPYAVFIEYKNGGAKPTTALVGKGLTFDSGGYNLKPTKFIEDMRMDMGGAATMFSTFKALVENKDEVNVVCALGLAENLIGKDAFKPGDIIKSKSGKTVEIGNTDAEGRLVLGDVLTYVQDNYKVDYMFDAATLTGAVTIGLGLYHTAILGNNQDLIDTVIKTGKESDEQLWQLPLDEDFEEMVKGKVSDLSNITGHRNAGTITATAFLKQFVKDEVKWAHFDIAGTCWITSGNWNIYDKNYATGIMVRTFYNSVKNIK